MKPQRSRSLVALTLALAVGATACASMGSGEVAWKPVVCYQAKGAIERIKCGHPDAGDPNLQAVSVDQAGDVALMHFRGSEVSSQVIYSNTSELTGLSISDLDPAVPGEEIYVGGYSGGTGMEGTGGQVLQLVLQPGSKGKARVRQIFSGPVYIHSVERVEPQAAGEGPKLLVSTYDGSIHLLTPTASGPWDDRVLHTEPPSDDPDAVKIKDVGFLRDPSGRAPHEALVAFKTGRLLQIDIDHPGDAHYILDEPGGLSRITPDPDGGAYVTGYFGRLMHWVPGANGLEMTVIDQEGVDSGLRGVVLGDFPVDGTVAHKVVFGFHKLCRALVPRLGVLDPVTLYVDIDRGHTIEAADLVPGNGADELLLGGYSLRVTMLVCQRP